MPVAIVAREKMWLLSGFAVFATLLVYPRPGAGQIYNWQTNQVIPGTQGITLGPGIKLAEWNTPGHELEYAELGGLNLAGAALSESDLSSADFSGSNLAKTVAEDANFTDANFSNSTLTSVLFIGSELRNANFSGASINGVSFYGSSGFTSSQLYTTASYLSHNLTEIQFSGDLTGWSFTNQDLFSAQFDNSILSNADLTGATVNDTEFSNAGLSANQLYSTASYQNGDLTFISIEQDLTGWNFSNQNLGSAALSGNLTNANLSDANLSNATLSGNFTNANFSGAVISGTQFYGVSCNLTPGQIYSTASYQSGNLIGIKFSNSSVAGWNFENQNLSDVTFLLSDASNADFHNATLSNVGFSDTTAEGANFTNSEISAGLISSDLRNANFTNATFNGTRFVDCALSNAVFGGATFNASQGIATSFQDCDLRGAIGWSPAGATINDTIYPDGIIPGLSMQYGEHLTIRNNSMPVDVTDWATFDPNSIIEFLLDADWTSPMSFGAGIVPSLAGGLDLELSNDANPSALIGDTFEIFDWNGMLPGGDRFHIIYTAPGYVWDTSQLYTNGTVTLVAIPEPATIGLIAAASALIIGRHRK